MSGVCGWVRFDGGPVEAAGLERMADAAAHRGPDGRGVWCSGGVGLAHLTLWVTPESARERQPLVTEADELALVADARIDNRDDLRAALSTAADATDADLILAAYRRWGVECAARLIGDFAFAIWDGRERRLFAARDPLGMRAFYYRIEPERVLFATELKQLLVVPGVPVRLFEPAVGAYLAGVFGPPEWTFYEGIDQLAPAHALVASADGHRTWRYWDIDPDHRIRYRREEEYTEHFRELFKEVVRARLRSIRPVGVLLSGGLDSGSIAATAGWLLRHGRVAVPELRAYSFAWDELPECDERHISAPLAAHYGIPVTDVPAHTAWPLAEYPEHGPDRDEPLIGAFQPRFESAGDLGRAAGVGLFLSGDRGDLVSGMNIFDLPALLRSGRWGTLLAEVRLLAEMNRVPPRRVVRWQLMDRIKAGLTDPEFRRIPATAGRLLPRRWSRPFHGPGWLRAGFVTSIRLDEIALLSRPRSPTRSYPRRIRYQYIFMPMHMRGVVWSERTHARFGQGFADPWSDVRMASFAMAVPQRILNTVPARKRLTREAMRGIMPEEARLSAQKILPQAAYDLAIRERARDTIRDLLTESQAARHGYIDEDRLRERYEAFVSGGPEDPYLWGALTLEMWLRRYWS